jgi:uncharacterized protein (DUF2141 family)
MRLPGKALRPAAASGIGSMANLAVLSTLYVLCGHVGCAHMEAPPGGPLDTKKPYVSAVLPAPDSTGVSRDLHVQIAFSEWVNSEVERGKVYLVPPIPHKLKVKLSGNLLDVTSKGRLDTNTTYTLGLLGSVHDLNGQPLESPLELVFSTGPKLDSGKLSGRVVPFQAKPTAGSFAALYPRGAELRARFLHLTRKARSGSADSAVTAEALANPAKEKPAYLAPADSLGRFSFKAVRPGRYGLLGFQDINGNLNPEVGTEAIAVGPTLEITSAGEVKTLSLSPYDTVPLKLAEAKWVNEIARGNQSDGTIRLKFNRDPHPLMSLRRDAYVVRKAGPHDNKGDKGNKNDKNKGDKKDNPGPAIPVQEVCVNPQTGEVELHTAPLDFDSEYVAQCVALKDAYGNAMDTAHSQAAFRITRAVDTTKAEMFFFGPRKVDGNPEKLGTDRLIPSRGIAAYYPRLLSDSVFSDLKTRLVFKIDTTPVAVTLVRANQHEFALQVPPVQLKGQRFQIGLKPSASEIAAASKARDSAAAKAPSVPLVPPAPIAPGDSAKKDTSKTATRQKPAEPAPATVATYALADAAKFGSLKFHQQSSAYGSRLALRSLSSPTEFTRLTPSMEEFVWDSLPEGWYAADYFRDANGDGMWNPGSLSPWTVQEPYVQWSDSVEVKAGIVGEGSGKGEAQAAGKAASGASPGPDATAGSGATAGTPATGPAAQSPEAAQPKAAIRKLAWPPLW